MGGLMTVSVANVIRISSQISKKKRGIKQYYDKFCMHVFSVQMIEICKYIIQA